MGEGILPQKEDLSTLELQRFVECSVRGLCKRADAVEVEVIPGGLKTVCILIKCASTDLALVIGRQGKNIRAIRDLAWAIAAKNQIKASVIVNE